MNSINSFIESVQGARKRTGIVYSSGSFAPFIHKLQEGDSSTQILDCATLYDGSLTFPAGELINEIELALRNKPGIVTNIETFIVSNSFDFAQQLAKLLIIREPMKPLFFLFYSKKIYTQFKNQYDATALNQNNTLEL